MNVSQYNICLVDDDRIYQFTAKKIIESTGFTQGLLSFYNGQEAIDYFNNNVHDVAKLPDIIFLDINMPVKDGWQFLEEFKQLVHTINKQITIFMVSSSVDDYDIKKSKEYSVVTDYIIKPINKERFIQLITSAFNK
ncbi:MAG: response regulator [Chitinophagaceae bacterium]|jgi:CheY-like chemotaxis protein|nr:response regulator [Chitinophagaceae bacterium]